MADKRLVSGVVAKLESLAKDRARPPLIGPGADNLRRAQSIIRRLAGLPLRTQSIRGAIRYRPVSGKASPDEENASFEPAIFSTPARMRAPTGTVPGDGLDASTPTRFWEFQRPLAAFQGFVKYVYLRKPRSEVVASFPEDTSTVAALEQFLGRAYDIIRSTVYASPSPSLSTEEPLHSSENVGSLESTPANGGGGAVVEDPYFADLLVEILYRRFLSHPAGALYERQERLEPDSSGDVLSAFREWLVVVAPTASWDQDSINNSCDSPALWDAAYDQVMSLFGQMYPGAKFRPYVDDTDEQYPFVPFSGDLVNFGLRLVYRQEWRPLGTQPGELVRTIPLAPKQTERVITETVVDDSAARAAESLGARGGAGESVGSIEESSDIVHEASRRLNWLVDSPASVLLGISIGNVSESMSDETASSSRDAKLLLNDEVEKIAGILRKQAKVVVATAAAGDEGSAAISELTNPSEEMAITYSYSKLLRQYEVSTRLHEVSSVIFVPERVPAWWEITDAWVRKHAWTLARALLDRSFEADLAQVVREVEEPPVDITHFRDAATSSVTALAEYRSFTGGDISDVFKTPQEIYERQWDKARARDLSSLRSRQSRQRLIDHIRQNILHYMRAIWSSEDPGQRLLRYSQIGVPRRWVFVPDPGETAPGYNHAWPGEFVPDYSEESVAPLSELIDPSGPIGFANNYAVFHLNSNPNLLKLNAPLSVLRSNYVRFDVSIVTDEPRVSSGPEESEAPVDSAATASLPKLTGVCALEPLLAEATYRMEFETTPHWKVTRIVGGEDEPVEVEVRISDDARRVEFEGIQVLWAELPAAQRVFKLLLRATDELQDPEERMLPLSRPLPTPEEEERFWSVDLLLEIGRYIPEVSAMLPANMARGWASLSEKAREAVKANYYRYLMLREYTRRILVDTGNLVLDLDTGAIPAGEAQ